MKYVSFDIKKEHKINIKYYFWIDCTKLSK